MNTRIRTTLLVLAGCAVLVLPVTGYAEPVEEVHQLLDRIEQAWERQDLELLDRECYDEDMLTIRSVQDGLREGAWVFSKKDQLDRIAGLWDRAGLKRRYVGREISVEGDVAWMRLTVADRATGRRYGTGEFLALALRRDGRWRLCLSMPLFVRTAVMVTEVLPDSQAEHLGIRPGDVMGACGTWAVCDADALDRWVQTGSGEGGNKTLPLVVIRGNDYLRFEVVPGPLGVRLEDRLLPAGRAVLIEQPEQHPISQAVQDRIGLLGADDWQGFLDRLCPQGYYSLEPVGSKPSRVTTRDTFKERWDEEMPGLREEFDLASFSQVRIRLIVAGDVALMSSRVTGVRRGEDRQRFDTPIRLQVYVRKNDRWWLAAILPKTTEIGLDPGGSIHLSPDKTVEQDALRRGRMTGLGISFVLDAAGVRIKEVFPNSGAARAGLEAGQIITAIDGRPTVGMSLEDAVKLLKGPEGTTVGVTVRAAGGGSRVTAVTRTRFAIPNVESRVHSGDIGIIRIRRFSEETAGDVRSAVTGLTARGVSGLMLDLRSGAGGFLSQMVKVIELFVPPGRRLFLTERWGEEPQATKSKEEQFTDLPLVVLIDDKSAGELVAAALKRTRRAKLVGHKTPGVTEVKELVRHSDGSSDVVVRGRFLVNRRTPLTGRGVQPHVRLPDDASPEQMISEALKALRAEIEGGPDG